MTLSRRLLLAATAASLAARALPAFAAPASFRHGAFEVTVVSDGHLVLPVSFLAPDAPPAERAALLKTSGETGEQYHSPTNVTLIRVGTDLILRHGLRRPLHAERRQTVDNLKAAGIDKGKISKVVFTTATPIISGAVDELDDLVTPDASFYVAAVDF